MALQVGPGQGFGHMQAAGTRLYIDLLRLFVDQAVRRASWKKLSGDLCSS